MNNKNAASVKRLSKKKQKAPLIDLATNLVVLFTCILTLILSFFWYHKDFQKPHTHIKSPIWVEIAFFQFGKFLFVLPFLGAIYKAITWSPRTLRAVRNSRVTNTLSNLSFSNYMVHAAWIQTKTVMMKSHSPLFFYDLLANFFGDLSPILLFSIMAALLIEMPCSSLWRSYADARFLRQKAK